MKRVFNIILVLLSILSYVCSAFAEREVYLTKGGLLASGYTIEAADALLAKAEKGEPLTPFHPVEYADYNSPAEENGLGDDKVLLYGTIRDYRITGSKNDYIMGFYLEQEDGNTWLVSCAAKSGGMLIGDDYTGKGTTVFDNLQGKSVEVYGTYLGFSEDFKVPVVDITYYGGLYNEEEDCFVMTRHAEYWMQRDGIYAFEKLIGARRRIVSVERLQ